MEYKYVFTIMIFKKIFPDFREKSRRLRRFEVTTVEQQPLTVKTFLKKIK